MGSGGFEGAASFCIVEELSIDFVGTDEVGKSYIFAVKAVTAVIARHCLLATDSCDPTGGLIL